MATSLSFPALHMSDGLARVLGCERVPFDAGGFPLPLEEGRLTFIVKTYTGAWMFWDFVPDEIARVSQND